MNRRFPIDPVTGFRVLADSTEQIAHDMRRTVAAAKAIVDGVVTLYEIAFPQKKQRANGLNDGFSQP